MGLRDMGFIDEYLWKASDADDLVDDSDDEGPRDTIEWRCYHCDEIFKDREPFKQYKGKPCCSELCINSLMGFDEAEQELESAVRARNWAVMLLVGVTTWAGAILWWCA